MNRVFRYTVVSSRLTTPSTFVVTLSIKEGRRPMLFKPGQYAAISFKGVNGNPTPARCFSIASSPTEKGYLQFGLKVGGSYTRTALKMLTPGAEVIVEGPFGSFTLDEEQDQSVMLIAGGIGVTPFMSMVRYATRAKLKNHVALAYSVRTQDEIPYLEELRQLRKLNPNFGIMFVVGSGPTDKLDGEYVTTGHIDGDILDYLLIKEYRHRSYLICGPPGFMKAVSTTLQEKGADPGTVKTEEFSQGQMSHRSLKHNIPLQVYSLAGLSIALSSGTITVSALATTVSNDNPNSTQASTSSSSSSSRQQAIDQTIANLESGGSQPVLTPIEIPTPPPPSPDPSSSPSPSPSPTPDPSPSPSPSPSPTPPPPPPPPPSPVAPSLNFYSSTNSISKGQSATLYWSINGDATLPVNCKASGSWSGAKATGGSQTVSPSSTATYDLQCSNSAGSDSGSITISVCTSTPSKPC